MKEIALAHFQSLLGRSNRDAFWENEGKIHARGCVKEFFFQKLAGWHHATLLQINFFTDIFHGFKVSFNSLTFSSGYFLFLYKMLEKQLWNSFLLYHRKHLSNSMNVKVWVFPSISHELGKIFPYIEKSMETSFPYLGIVWDFKFNRFLFKAHSMEIY